MAAAICRDMGGPRDGPAEWDKPDRQRQTPQAITYMWHLKHDTNERVYKTES